MASFKETSVSRPVPQMGTPVRQPQTQRSHSHSISLGAINANHRVTRRKSMSRRGTESTSIGATSGFSSYLSRGIHAASPDTAAVATAAVAVAVARKPSPSSIDENLAGEASGQEDKHVSTKNRNRRASEGSPLVRGEGKRVSTELRCDQCGKGYKHSSCLTKHMWEHNPAWAVTSKLLISKHQQVQLLEAATVLVAMNQETADAAAEVAAAVAAAAAAEEVDAEANVHEIESDNSSASPGASSDIHDGISSTETTPPPMDEDEIDLDDDKPYGNNHHHFSYNHPSAFSRSYQSVASSSYADNGSLHSPAFSHFRHSSIDTRPSTAETTGVLEEDSEASDLVAAIRLCNFGTPRSSAVATSSDVPPVPPLPARYLGQQSGVSHAGSVYEKSSFGITGSTPAVFGSFSLDPSQSYKVSDERDVKMGDADRESRRRRNNDVDFGSRHTHDDDDDGVFGRMEE